MEQQGNEKAPSSLLPGVLDRLGLRNTPPPTGASLESLIAALGDADWHKRAAAISALEEYPGSVSLGLLLTALYDEDVSVRAAAVYALGNRKEQVAIEQLTEALHDPEWLVREAAVLTLGKLGEQVPIRQLTATLDDENEFVRESAKMALEQPGPQALSTDAPAANSSVHAALATFMRRTRQLLVPFSVSRGEDTHNEHLHFDSMDEEVTITDLAPGAYSSHSRRQLVLTKPLRLATIVLTALIVITLLAGLLLLPRLRSQPSTGNLSFHPVAVLFSTQGGAFFPAWTADGKHLAFVDDQGNMYLWDASTRKLSKAFTLPTNVDPDPLAVWTWMDDGRHIISFNYKSGNRQMQVWDVIAGRSVLTNDSQIFDWSPDGKRLALLDKNDHIQIWSIDTGKELSTIASEQFRNLSSIDWSPGGQQLAATFKDGTVQIWDAATGQELQNFSDPGIASQNSFDFAYAVWSPDGKRLIPVNLNTTGTYRTLQIWDVATGRKLFTFSGQSAPPFMVQWFSDGKRILSASLKDILVWDSDTGRAILRLPNNGSQYADKPVLSPNERLLAYSDGGLTIQIWDTTTGHKIVTYRGHTAGVITTSITWSPDSRYIASADTDGNVLVWEAHTGKLVLRYKLALFLPSNFIPTHLVSPAWSLDGKMLAITSDVGPLVVLQAP